MGASTPQNIRRNSQVCNGCWQRSSFTSFLWGGDLLLHIPLHVLLPRQLGYLHMTLLRKLRLWHYAIAVPARHVSWHVVMWPVKDMKPATVMRKRWRSPWISRSVRKARIEAGCWAWYMLGRGGDFPSWIFFDHKTARIGLHELWVNTITIYAYYFPMSRSSALRGVVALYEDWCHGVCHPEDCGRKSQGPMFGFLPVDLDASKTRRSLACTKPGSFPYRATWESCNQKDHLDDSWLPILRTSKKPRAGAKICFRKQYNDSSRFFGQHLFGSS